MCRHSSDKGAGKFADAARARTAMNTARVHAHAHVCAPASFRMRACARVHVHMHNMNEALGLASEE